MPRKVFVIGAKGRVQERRIKNLQKNYEPVGKLGKRKLYARKKLLALTVTQLPRKRYKRFKIKITRKFIITQDAPVPTGQAQTPALDTRKKKEGFVKVSLWLRTDTSSKTGGSLNVEANITRTVPVGFNRKTVRDDMKKELSNWMRERFSPAMGVEIAEDKGGFEEVETVSKSVNDAFDGVFWTRGGKKRKIPDRARMSRVELLKQRRKYQMKLFDQAIDKHSDELTE